MNFEVNLVFLTQAVFSTWPKSRYKNLDILRTKASFKDEIKSIFHQF